MKLILLLMITLFTTPTSFAKSEKMIRCTLREIPNAQKWIDEQYYNTYDKFKHCAVSCYLGLRCGKGQVGLIGVLKEIRDAFGYGNAEIADIKADFYGIKLVRKKLATSDELCGIKCDERYPKP